MTLKVNYFYFEETSNLQKRKQRVDLNGQTSEWREIISGLHQGLMLGSLLFLKYMNDCPDGITSLREMFADDTFLFSKVRSIDKYIYELNADLEKISQWTYQLKM